MICSEVGTPSTFLGLRLGVAHPVASDGVPGQHVLLDGHLRLMMPFLLVFVAGELVEETISF